MSLLDALLLDPVRIDIYLANRPDLSTGSGTEMDAYNAGLLLDSTSVTITSFTASSQDVTASVTSHAFNIGDVILISGAADPLLNGAFTLVGKTTTSFSFALSLASPSRSLE